MESILPRSYLDVVKDVLLISGLCPAFIDMIPVINAASIWIDNVGDLFKVENIRPSTPVVDAVQKIQKWRNILWVAAVDPDCNNFESEKIIYKFLDLLIYVISSKCLRIGMS